MATQLLVNKYAYHLPVYRQQDIFAGTGWTPSRSTMLNILKQCYFIVEPLLDYFKRITLTDSIVACDDTGVTLLYPKVPPEFDLNDPIQPSRFRLAPTKAHRLDADGSLSAVRILARLVQSHRAAADSLGRAETEQVYDHYVGTKPTSILRVIRAL